MTPIRAFPLQTRTWLTVAALALLSACASVPPPTHLMQQASRQLDAARAAQAADYAPVDLSLASKRYQSAQTAMQAQKYALARDLANESLADGRLAQTRAELAHVRKTIRQQQAENKRLRAQLLNPPAPARAPANAGLPTQITLPTPAAPAPASSTPAPAPVRGGQP